MQIRFVAAGALVLVLLPLSSATASTPVRAGLGGRGSLSLVGRKKRVIINVKNVSAEALELSAGDRPVTVEAGRTLPVEVPVGEALAFRKATGAHAAGELLIKAEVYFDHSTVTVR